MRKFLSQKHRLTELVINQAEKLMVKFRRTKQRELTNKIIDAMALKSSGVIKTSDEEKRLACEITAVYFEYLHELRDGKEIAQIWNHRFFDNMSVRDIAKKMRMGNATVCRKLSRSYKHVIKRSKESDDFGSV